MSLPRESWMSVGVDAGKWWGTVTFEQLSIDIYYTDATVEILYTIKS